MDYIVHKFGGTSVGDASRYRHVAELILKQKEAQTTPLIVVSAMSKVTDALIQLVHLAKAQDNTYLEKIESLYKRHQQTIDELLNQDSYEKINRIFLQDFEHIKEILRGVFLARSHSEQIIELVSGYGELWSAQMLNAHFQDLKQKSNWIDARSVLFIDPTPGPLKILWPQSTAALKKYLEQNPASLFVVTGYIASFPDGSTTTLKRNGSDFSASIFGSLSSAKSIVIWTDVDGVLSADPRRVPEAVLLDDLSYKEATELAYFGAKVVHPKTMMPAIEKNIPIWIKNTFNPSCAGTKIHSHSNSTAPIKGFTTIDQVALLNIEGTGMLGVPGVAQRLFSALREVGVSVIMISQASSEQSICVIIPHEQLEIAKKAVSEAFAYELQMGSIQTIDTDADVSILAAVGDNMILKTGIAGKFLHALGQAKVNVRAIAQGSSERNISVVISKNDTTRALRAVHSAFYLSKHTLSVGVLGVGVVGKALLNQLRSSSKKLREELNIDLKVRAIGNSKNMILSDQGQNLETWHEDLQKSNLEINISEFINHVNADHLPHSVFIDCTSDPKIAASYESLIKKGIHIITPNKKANTQSMADYKSLKKAILDSNMHFLYETNVGAGLPLINTLRELVRTGDQIYEIEGVLSGTLSYIFNTFSKNKPFSDVVKEAKEKGYTEPDPRDDLSGLDVARKLVILAREMGLSIEVADVEIEALLPKKLSPLSVDDFLKELPSVDKDFSTLLETAATHQKVLRYVGYIDHTGKAKVTLKSYDNSHSFARINATDNIVAFKTLRYQQPLIIQGPGAGPEVTAAGVFADILRLSSYLGAPL